MAGKYESTNKQKKKWPWIVGVCLLAAVAAAVILLPNRETSGIPTLTVETPQKVSLSGSNEVVLDVTVSDLGAALYPAMSMSISFDPSRLEFLGIQEGNLFVYDDSNSVGRQLPDWSYNVQNSNETGLINVMYLDMTGGRHAFSRDLLEEGAHVVLRLAFRLRGSVSTGAVLDLIVEDAVFAASDETQSLAMNQNTLNIKNGKIVVGE